MISTYTKINTGSTPSNTEPIFVSGSKNDTFESIVANVALQILDRSKVNTSSTRRSKSLNLRWLQVGAIEEEKPLDLASQIKTISDVANLLRELAENFTIPVIVVDEFDTIGSEEERGKFASLLKIIGDQGTNIKFIFTGIGDTIADLLGAHDSSFRQLATIELPRLPIDARMEIANKAAEAFNLILDYDVCCRIAIISDGYPYYVHLIMEEMLWIAFHDEENVSELDSNIFNAGLRSAIENTTAELKRPYEKAVIHRKSEYETALWATADNEDTASDLNRMYLSYREINQKKSSEEELKKEGFSKIIRDFRKSGFGSILEGIPNRPGWYTYKEKMLRGYVRMQAEANGISLYGAVPNPKQVMRPLSNARTGYRGPSFPPGVRSSRPIGSWEEDE